MSDKIKRFTLKDVIRLFSEAQLETAKAIFKDIDIESCKKFTGVSICRRLIALKKKWCGEDQ